MGDLGLKSTEELDRELCEGRDPNRIVIPFLDVALVHYWAELGSLPHLKILYKRGADFTRRTRMGTTVKDELQRNVRNKPDIVEYAACLNWLESINIPIDR